MCQVKASRSAQAVRVASWGCKKKARPYSKVGVGSLMNAAVCVCCTLQVFNTRKMSPVFTPGAESDVPPVFVDRFGAKAWTSHTGKGGGEEEWGNRGLGLLQEGQRRGEGVTIRYFHVGDFCRNARGCGCWGCATLVNTQELCRKQEHMQITVKRNERYDQECCCLMRQYLCGVWCFSN
jgi:hypothetical protein